MGEMSLETVGDTGCEDIPEAPVRVMYVVPDLGVGGAERHVTTLLPGLDPARFEASAVCIGADGALFPDLGHAGIPAVALRRTRRQALQALLDLVREMRRRRPDVVITRGYNAEVLGRVAAILAGVPHRVVWVHNCGDLAPRGRLRHLADRVLDRWTDAYFGVAQAQVPYLVDELHYRPDKICIIHNGVDVSRFRTRTDRSALEEWGIDAGAPVVGIVAALRAEKDHTTLLRAVQRLTVRFPALTVLVVGDGSGRESILRAARELGIADRTVLAGSRDDVADLLSALTVFALTSYTIECFPMALLEAMAAGRAAVCTDVGGIAELLVDGETGLLAPPRDPEALADQLAVVLGDHQLRRRMEIAARRRVESRFSLPASASAAAAALLAVARTPGRRPVPRPIQLTVVLDLTFVGGVETLLLDLFRHFDPELVRPRLVCLRAAGPLAEEFRAAGFEVEVLERTGRFDRRTLPRLVRSLRAHRTDAVLVPHHHRAALALGRLAAKIAGVPVNLVAAHDMDLTFVGSRVLPRWAVRTLGWSDALVLLSESQGRYLRREEGVGRYPWEATREVVIPNGIEVPPHATPADRRRARALLGVDPDDVVIGVVGRLSRQKAHEVLFDAFAACLPDFPRLRLAVIGGGPRDAELREYCRSIGISARTLFLGTRRDVVQLLAGIDVCCLSSVHEGVPIALIEAMAAGVPVIATDCGSVRDIVEDGQQGFVTPVGDVPAFADRLATMARQEELRQRLGRNARERAEREFRIETTARGYERLLSDLLARSGAVMGSPPRRGAGTPRPAAGA